MSECAIIFVSESTLGMGGVWTQSGGYLYVRWEGQLEFDHLSPRLIRG